MYLMLLTIWLGSGLVGAGLLAWLEERLWYGRTTLGISPGLVLSGIVSLLVVTTAMLLELDTELWQGLLR